MGTIMPHTADRTKRRKALEDAVSGYYGSLSPDEYTESAAWGEFALHEFAGFVNPARWPACPLPERVPLRGEI
jgi:hypothetical protein